MPATVRCLVHILKTVEVHVLNCVQGLTRSTGIAPAAKGILGGMEESITPSLQCHFPCVFLNYLLA